MQPPKRKTIFTLDEAKDTWQHDLVDADEEERNSRGGWALMLLIIVSAAIASSIAFGIKVVLPMLAAVKMTHVVPLMTSLGIPSLLASILWNFALLFIAYLLVHLVPAAGGSGLPEIRTMLSGSKLPDSFLALKVGIAKAIGLTLSIGAQLPLGTEGPFVHIAAVTAHQLQRIPPFSGLARTSIESTVAMAMVSVGSGATLSAPISGALLGLEFLMPHVIDRTSYAMCFTAAAIGSLCVYLLKLASGQGYTPLFSTDIQMVETNTFDKFVRLLVLTLPLGALCGMFGGLFVHWQNAVGLFYKKLRTYCSPPPKSLSEPLVGPPKKSCCPTFLIDLVLLAGVGTIIALIIDFEPRFGMGPPLILGLCFSIDPLAKPIMGQEALMGLLLMFLAKFLLTAAALRLPIPNGCVGPCLVIGAMLGRCWAHLTDKYLLDVMGIFADVSMKDEDFAWFAIVGAAAFTAAVCRTFSIVVAVFELLAVPTLILPLSFTTLLAMSVANVLSPSIFDSIAMFKNLPLLPVLCNPHAHDMMQPVESFMRCDLVNLTVPRNCSKSVLQSFIANFSTLNDPPHTIGIVEGHPGGDHGLLLGCFKARNMQFLLDRVSGTGQVDVFSEVAHLGLLEHTLSLMPSTALKTAYIEAQTISKHPFDAVFYVCENGMVLGVLTSHDLKRAAHL